MSRVLVVDDDPVIVRLLEVNLRLDGYEVETASRGEQALDRATETDPDLVILDVMMPGLEEVPVVFLTARAEDATPGRGEELGDVQHVTKPFDPLRLVEMVRRGIAGDES